MAPVARWLRSLRARIFVVTAIALAAATALAGVLSRQATLVEERQVLGARPAAQGRLTERASAAFASGGWRAVSGELASIQAETGASFLVVDPSKQVVAASTTELMAARVRAASSDGVLSLQISHGASAASVEVRGVPPQPVNGPDGRSIAEVFQVPGQQAVADTHKDLIPAWLVAILATGGLAIVITLLVSDRLLRPVHELTQAARRMAAGDLDARVSTGSEDELGRLAVAFNVMAARVSENEKTKRQMVSDIAHELRSPVTNLRCTLEAIQDGLVPAAASQIDLLHHETLLLQRLIADLQDLALSDAGGLRLREAAIDLDPLIHRAAAPDGRHEIVIDVAPDARQAWGDASRIEQILRNLLDNAKRHTPAGGRITVSACRDDASVRITVSDSGEGIAPQHLAKIFDRFYRADPSRDRASGGAGLGLAVVRRLVEAHGGVVSASSEGPGTGATFTFTLPVRPGAVAV